MTLTAEGPAPADLPAPDDAAIRQPPPASPVAEDLPRILNPRSVDDVMSVVGSAFAALAFTWVVYEHVLLWSGVLGFVVFWWCCAMCFCASVSMLANPAPIVKDRLVSLVVQSGAAVVGLALASTVIYVFIQGWPALHHWNFFSKTMAGVAPGASLSKGGVEHAIVGTGIEVGISTVIALPIGVVTAVYMTEVGGRLANAVRTVVEAMTALPDVLAGLFVYTLLIRGLHWQQTGFAVGLALAVTMTPTVARSAEVVLRVVPSGLREASLALGASRWQTVRRVVVPTSRAGLATSLILGVARVAGETAPLLILSRSTTYFNNDPLHNPMNSLPLFIYVSIRSGEPVAMQRGYGAATLLLSLVLILFVLTRFLARDKNGRRK